MSISELSTQGAPDAGIPDAGFLAQLANQLFAALPGGQPNPGALAGQLPAGLSHLAGAPAQQHPFAVSNVIGPSQGFTPDAAIPSALPTSSTQSGFATGVPASVPVGGLPHLTGTAPGNTVTAPVAQSTPTVVPTSFTGDLPLGSNPAGHTANLQPALTLNPLDWGLPSEADLASVLQLRSPERRAQGGPGVVAGAPSFYFLEQTPHLTPSGSPQVANGFDVHLIRRDFPVLSERVNGRPLVWLDNAATTQKPQSVIDRIAYFYAHENSNIHRAAHELAARATDAYEAAREKVRGFLNARSTNEIVFVRGTTEAINLVAKSWGQANLRQGDEIIVSWLEHHANIVPWQQLCEVTGARLRVIPVDDDGQVLLDEYAKLLSPKTKLVSFTQVSNALGTVTPAKQMVAMAQSVGARVLVDGAQSVSHMRADVIDLNCDWFVFSGHKVFGPTGIGVLYGKEDLLNETPPWQGGGNMIKDVTFEHTQYHDAPGRFEAGTGNIADAVGLGAAIDYVNRLGIDNIHAYEHQLLLYATRLLKDVPGLKLIGTAPDKAAVLSFTLAGFMTEEVGAALNKEGVAVRSGHHCAQPILRRFGLEATVRPSLAFYNNCADVDTLVGTLHKLVGQQRRV